MQGGCIAGPQRPLEHWMGNPVQLDEHHTGYVGDVGRAGSPAGASGRGLVEPRVVVDGQQGADQRGDRGEPDGDEDRRPEAVEVYAGQGVEHQGHDEGFEDDGTEAEGQHRDRDDDEGQGGPDDRTDEADHQPGQQGVSRSIDPQAGKQGGEDPQGDRRHDGHDRTARERRATTMVAPPVAAGRWWRRRSRSAPIGEATG